MDKKYRYSKEDYNGVLVDMMKRDPETFGILSEGNKYLASFAKENPEIQKLLTSMHNIMQALTPLKEFIKPVFEAQEAIKEYVSFHLELSEKIRILPLNGWYLNVEFIDKLGVSVIAPLLSQEDMLLSTSFITAVTTLFEEDFLYIKGKVISAFPKRSKLLQSIFNLHTQGEYEAAINLALTQVDGICKDVFTKTMKDGTRKPLGFFDNESDKKVQSLSKSITPPANSLLSLLSKQLAATDRNDHPLLKSNTTDLSDLNRHAILHGESIEYGTYINSVKAILLLDFVVQLRDFHEWSLEEKELMQGG